MTGDITIIPPHRKSEDSADVLLRRIEWLIDRLVAQAHRHREMEEEMAYVREVSITVAKQATFFEQRYVRAAAAASSKLLDVAFRMAVGGMVSGAVAAFTVTALRHWW
jgi:hypothetical protein